MADAPDRSPAGWRSGEAAGDLPPLGREELAEADRLKVELEAHYAAGRFAEARNIVRRQLALRRRWLGSEHELIGKCLLNLAMCTHDLGDLGGAEVLYQASIAIYRRRLGAHLDTANAINTFGTLKRARQELSEAERLFREAEAVRREILGGDHPVVGQSLNNLGNVLLGPRRTRTRRRAPIAKPWRFGVLHWVRITPTWR